jgi:hypothetical protein
MESLTKPEEGRKQMKKSPMPMIAGIINIVSGVLTLLGFVILFSISIITSISVLDLNGCDLGVECVSAILFLISSFLFILGILSIFGGINALKRRKWGWALASSVCALLFELPLGIVSIVLIALSKNEFE